jgi:hypothetical protein
MGGRYDGALPQHQFGLRAEGAHSAQRERPGGERPHPHAARRSERPRLPEAQSQRSGADTDPRRPPDRGIFADPLLHRRRLSRSTADAEGAATAASRAHVQQADRRIHAQCLHHHDVRDRVPAELPEDAARGVAGRDQQGAAQAASGVQAQRDRAWARFRIRHRRVGAAQEALVLDGRLAERGPLSRRQQLLQRRRRGDPLYPAARAPQARQHVGAASCHRRLVGAHAGAALGQGCHLRPHDRDRLGSVQEPRPRAMPRCRSC